MGGDFKFKRFTIRQSNAAMKVGTDGVLLGAWCTVGRCTARALDIGTGTGLIALMVAQRGEDHGLVVDGVEIDAGSYSQACENAQASPWSDRVHIYHQRVQDFAADTRTQYDLIVSNPPYFVDSLLPPDRSRSAARHTTDLSYGELAGVAARMLSPQGVFAVIVPCDQVARFTRETDGCGLRLVRRTDVLPTSGSAPKRSMMEFAPNLPSTLSPENPDVGSIVIEDGGRHLYSQEYIDLTRDFYLKF